ncbi:MAG TPA: peptidoglycan DD-metalloendopeptidase family protein [Rhodanobacteraceae bacterium]
MREFFLYLSCGLCLTASLTFMPIPAHAGITGQQTSVKKKLAAVKQRLQALADKQRATAGKRDAINTRLAAQADQLNAAAHAVRTGNRAIAASQSRLNALEKQRATLKTSLASQREALADLLRAAYKIQNGSNLRLLLGDADMAKLARTLAYSRYFQHDRIQRIRALLGQLASLNRIEAGITQQQQALKAARAQGQQRLAALQASRQKQQALLAKVDAQLKTQHRQMRQLEQNRQTLDKLLVRLRNVFADIPDHLPASTLFAHRRGKLPWPVHGKVQRYNEGITIRAARGTPVRAVAHGRVAFANWLRGYGLLVIIDHGNGWMSLYGGNESLETSVGDWVNAGQPIATAGASASDASGVYFGLRHRGKPVNPLPWLAKH